MAMTKHFAFAFVAAFFLSTAAQSFADDSPKNAQANPEVVASSIYNESMKIEEQCVTKEVLVEGKIIKISSCGGRGCNSDSQCAAGCECWGLAPNSECVRVYNRDHETGEAI